MDNYDEDQFDEDDGPTSNSDKEQKQLLAVSGPGTNGQDGQVRAGADNDALDLGEDYEDDEEDVNPDN